MSLKTVDLRGLSRDSDRIRTEVKFDSYSHSRQFEDRQPWLVLGSTNLDRTGPTWTLKSYLAEGITDQEHDSAFCLHLGLVGVEFKHTWYGTSFWTAWISSDINNFKVAPANYQEILDKYGEPCDHCTGEDAHPMVPGDLWTPPENKKFFEWARGAQVEITIGPTHPDD
jgi:hypothetical protein